MTGLALAVVLATAGCSSAEVVSEDGRSASPTIGAEALTIDAPEDGTVTAEQTVTVTGSAPDGADVVRSVSFGLDQHTTATGGQWSMTVKLEDGENLFTFRVGDDDSTATTLLVVRSAEAAPTGSAKPAASTPKPTPTAKPAKSPAAATEPPGAKPLSVKVTKRTPSVLRNQTASVSIRTVKGARCDITVFYNSGPSTAKGLDPKTANSSGDVTWKWKVGGNTAKGTYDISIDCQKGDTDGSVDTSFQVK